MEESKFKAEKNKAAAVINSCRTNEQAIAAITYLELAVRLWNFRKCDKMETAKAENVLLKRLQLRQYQITAAECL